jgi:hypothetical protein
VKAIFEFAAAPRLDRAESAEDASCDCALRPRRAKSYSDERHERHDCGVPAPSALPPLPRLLDQRLDEGVELPVRDGIARALWSRWGGDGHNFLRSPIELVLLGP